MLEAGGNAVDAAIAANAVLGLTQPYVNGMGGDLFAIYYEAKTGKVYGLNSSGWTPKALTIDYLKGKGVDQTRSAQRPHDHRARLRRGMGRAAEALRHEAVFGSFSRRRSTTRRTASRCPRSARGAGSRARCWSSRATGRRTCRAACVRSSGRRVQESGAGRIAAAGRGQGPRRVLQGVDGREPGEVPAVPGRRAHSGGLRRVRAGMGGADLDHVPRLAGLRAAAQRTGRRGALHAQHHGELPAQGLRPQLGGRAARDDRGQETGLRRSWRSYVGDPRFGPVPVNEMLSKDLAKQRRGADQHGQGVVQGAAFRNQAGARRARHARPSTCRRSTRTATSSR